MLRKGNPVVYKSRAPKGSPHDGKTGTIVNVHRNRTDGTFSAGLQFDDGTTTPAHEVECKEIKNPEEQTGN